MTSRRLLLYGAYGYTGELVARRAVERGLAPVLAGRRRAPLERLARELGLEWRAFPLENAAALDAAAAGCAAVLHCAGPFSRTWRPVAAACFRAGSHYVDITGERQVLERLAALGPDAAARGVMLLPAAGFDVVPADALAAHLVARLPSASRLVLAMRGFGRMSRGTARTVLDGLPTLALPHPRGPRVRELEVAGRTFTGVALPTADVWAVRRATGVRDVTLYLAAPLPLRLALRAAYLAAPLAPVLRLAPLRELAVGALARGRAGPVPEERARGHVDLLGEASSDSGARVAARLRVPEAYSFTALAVVAAAERILAGDAPPGFQTASTAWGPDFAASLPGVTREDVA